eukprot:1016150-Amphidinium_carterae.1
MRLEGAGRQVQYLLKTGATMERHWDTLVAQCRLYPMLQKEGAARFQVWAAILVLMRALETTEDAHFGLFLGPYVVGRLFLLWLPCCV